jgi:hypothetical protein
MDLLKIVALSALLAAPAAAGSYLADQEIDREAGLLEIPWSISLVRMYTWSDLPAQMQWGFPPYDQQPVLTLKPLPICRLGALACI